MSEVSRINEAHLLMVNESYPVIHRQIVNLMADRDSARAAAVTPLQATALDALMAWRKADLDAEAAPTKEYQDMRYRFFARDRDLKDAADRLIAERAKEALE